MVKLNLDFRLFDPQAELSSLRSSIDTLEQQLAALTEARTRTVEARIAAMTPEEFHEGEAQLARQELEYEVEYTLPRIYRGALLLLIWSAYESGVQQVTSFLTKRMHLGLDLSDMSGRTALDKAKRFYRGVLRIELFTDEAARSQLGELEKVRNAIAHATGRLASLRPSARRSIDSMIESGRLAESLGSVLIPQRYLSSAMDLVDRELSGLIRRALYWDDSQKLETKSGQGAPGSK